MATATTVRIGSIVIHCHEFDRMLAFCARHSIAPVVEFLPMSQLNEAFERLRQGKAHYRIVLTNDGK